MLKVWVVSPFITQPLVFACEPFLKRRLLLYLYHDECTACLTWCAESDEGSQNESSSIHEQGGGI